MARESERPIAAVARDLGMHHETLRVVAAIEDQATCEQPKDDPASTVRLAGSLLDEVECDGADQHAPTKGHDEPDYSDLDLDDQRDDRADHERGRRQGPPSEGHPDG
jgi:hypothetical protein